jgi:hypothetical protein
MPSTERKKLELKPKDVDGSDRLTAGCVLTDLVTPAFSRMVVYAKGRRVQKLDVLLTVHRGTVGP